MIWRQAARGGAKATLGAGAAAALPGEESSVRFQSYIEHTYLHIYIYIYIYILYIYTYTHIHTYIQGKGYTTPTPILG